MSHRHRLHDPEYKNWVLAGLGLLYLKEGLEEYLDTEIKSFHAQLMNTIALDLNISVSAVDCSIQTYIKHPMKSIPVYDCSAHSNKKPSDCPKICPNRICNAISNEITKAHRFGRPNGWKNSIANKWTSDPWGIGKCFLSTDGYNNCRSATDIDCSGLLSICINVKPIGDKLKLAGGIDGKKDIFTQVRQYRNMILHSSSYKLKDLELQLYINKMLELISVIPSSTTTSTAVNKLTKVKKGDCYITDRDLETMRNESLNAIRDVTQSSLINIEVEAKGAIGNIHDVRKTALETFSEASIASKSEIEKTICNGLSKLKTVVEEECVKVKKCQKDVMGQEKETIPWHIREQFKRTLSIWENEEDMFIPTRATENTTKLLLHSKFIMVTGSSGSGKSSLIHHIALKLYREQGYEIVPSTPNGPCDLLMFHNHHKKQIFVVDDAFGKSYLNISLVEQWSCKVDRLKEIFRIHDDEICPSYAHDMFDDTNEKTSMDCNKETIVMISCQNHLVKEKRVQQIINSLLISQIDMHSDDNELLADEKQLILQCYSSCVQMEDLCTDFDYFPLMCRLSYGKTESDIKSIFADPPRHIFRLLVEIKDTDTEASKYQFCCITLCVLFDKGFDLQWLQYWTKRNKWCVSGQVMEESVSHMCVLKICAVCIEYGVDLELENHRNRLIDSFSMLVGPLLKTNSSIQFIVHDKVYEIAAKLCGEALISLFITHSSSDFISQRFKMIFVNLTKHSKHLITVPSFQESNYFDRILRDIDEFDIRSFIFNIQIENPDYRTRLIQYVEEVGKIGVLHDFFQNHLTEIERSLGTIIHKFDVYLSFLVDFGVNKSNVLVHACVNNNVVAAMELLKDNVDVVKIVPGIGTPLVAACRNDCADVTHLLLNKFGKVLLSHIDDIPPLYIASFHGHTDIVKLLLEHNADTSLCRTDNGASPLYIASYGGHIDTVKLLLQYNADTSLCRTNDGVSPLYIACNQGKTDVVKLLLEHNADTSLCRTDNGASPLYTASYVGYIDTVKLLLQHNADTSLCRTNDGVSPLYIACNQGKTDVVKLLLEHNADTSLCRTDNGASPLYTASYVGYIDTVKLLLQHNADTSLCRTNDGVSPLYIACNQGKTDVVKLLLEHNADTSLCRTDNGASPLYTASYYCHTDIVKLLLQHNADNSLCRTDNGESPLYTASYGGHIDTVKLLLQYNADTSLCRTNDGVSPLYIACNQGKTDVVKMLLEHNADTSLCRTDNGESPLYTASYHDHTDTVKLLLEYKADILLKQRDIMK